MAKHSSIRVCVDCSPLLVRSAGVKTYLYHWLRALRAEGRVNTLFEPPDRGLDLNGGVFVHPLRLAWLESLKRLPPLAMNLLAGRCDVFHASNLLRHVPARCRITATLHDLTAWTVPQCHRIAQVRADLLFADGILRRADGLIAVSEHTRADAVRILGLDPDKIRVIYPGISEHFSTVDAPQVRTAALAHGITGSYFLFTGTLEPRKNLDGLLDAWMLLPRAMRHDTQLLVAGMPGWDFQRTLKRLSQMAEDGAGVRYLGYVPEQSLPGLTAGARALIYPSFYEGFGLPVAQAMAAGCPVITSNVSSLPEITAGCALLIDPNSPAEIAAAISRLHVLPELRSQMAEKGRQAAYGFTWGTAAVESFRFFQELVG
jgi:glycosyltransferase involved in cell wall biosynthesis